MPEHPIEEEVITSELIADLAARSALETPGVLRLEPTAQGLLATLGSKVILNIRSADNQESRQRHDGVTATVTGGTADVHIDLATDIAFTALKVTESVQQRVRESINHTGLAPGRIDISILAIEHPTVPKII